MENRNLRDILDEGGFIDYRDIFKKLEIHDEFNSTLSREDDNSGIFEDEVDSHKDWLKLLKKKKAKRVRKAKH